MVYTERAETAAVPCGTTHQCRKFATLVGIEKHAVKRLPLNIESNASNVNLFEIGKYRYIIAINNSSEDVINLVV